MTAKLRAVASTAWLILKETFRDPLHASGIRVVNGSPRVLTGFRDGKVFGGGNQLARGDRAAGLTASKHFKLVLIVVIVIIVVGFLGQITMLCFPRELTANEQSFYHELGVAWMSGVLAFCGLLGFKAKVGASTVD